MLQNEEPSPSMIESGECIMSYDVADKMLAPAAGVARSAAMLALTFRRGANTT